MANYNNLKSAIQSVIRANGNNEITGPILQAELLAMITTLGTGYQYMGVAQPSTNPGTPDARVMYLAYMAGTYVNFGGITVTGFCVLKYDTTWTKTDIPISSSGGGGKSPYIGANGNWYEWSDSEGAYIDTGIRTQGPQGEDGVGFQTITTLQDGTMVITLTSEDTITINLNHNHLAYPKYQLLTDEAEYAALTTKESDTLYLIPE